MFEWKVAIVESPSFKTEKKDLFDDQRAFETRWLRLCPEIDDDHVVVTLHRETCDRSAGCVPTYGTWQMAAGLLQFGWLAYLRNLANSGGDTAEYSCRKAQLQLGQRWLSDTAVDELLINRLITGNEWPAHSSLVVSRTLGGFSLSVVSRVTPVSMCLLVAFRRWGRVKRGPHCSDVMRAQARVHRGKLR